MVACQIGRQDYILFFVIFSTFEIDTKQKQRDFSQYSEMGTVTTLIQVIWRPSRLVVQKARILTKLFKCLSTIQHFLQFSCLFFFGIVHLQNELQYRKIY